MYKVVVMLLAALLFPAASAQAQVYKWVDAKGVTHYDDKPPENVKSKEVPLRGAAAAPAPAPAGDAAWQEKERAFKQRQVERNDAEAKKAQEQAKLAAQCQKAGVNLADLKATGRVFNRNEKGEREFLTDKERDSLIAARQEEYNQHCK